MVVVDKKSCKVICTDFCNGKQHDFRLFKASQTHIHKDIQVEVDTGFVGITKIHANSVLPKKRSKKKPLTKDDKKRNRRMSSSRVRNEHAIGFIKRCRIVSERYRGRRKRFGLRFNLIAGICNYEVIG